MSESLHLPKSALEDLIAILWREGFQVLGPVARDGAVGFDEVRKVSRPGSRDARDAGARALPARRQGAPGKFSEW